MTSPKVTNQDGRRKTYVMTKLIKKLLFVSIDGIAQTVYNLRERHLLNLNERLDRLAGKFWNESDSY